MIGVCTTCGKNYEAGSEEQACEPGSTCRDCHLKSQNQQAHSRDVPAKFSRAEIAAANLREWAMHFATNEKARSGVEAAGYNVDHLIFDLRHGAAVVREMVRNQTASIARRHEWGDAKNGIGAGAAEYVIEPLIDPQGDM